MLLIVNYEFSFGVKMDNVYAKNLTMPNRSIPLRVTGRFRQALPPAVKISACVESFTASVKYKQVCWHMEGDLLYQPIEILGVGAHSYRKRRKPLLPLDNMTR